MFSFLDMAHQIIIQKQLFLLSEKFLKLWSMRSEVIKVETHPAHRVTRNFGDF